MARIDFVPNDYVQQKECGRANFLYLVLFGILMGAIGVTFSIIKMRQRAVESHLAALEQKMAAADTQIAQLDKLKRKTTTMMHSMVTTAELLEPVPRSVVLACLTNNLPGGVSLLELDLKEKDIAPAAPKATPKTSQYQKAQAAQKPDALQPGETPRQARTRTTVEIKGIAPSDIEVATYIARLGTSILMSEVALVESQEHIIDDVRFREFKLTATLKEDITLTKEDIERIRRPTSRDT